MCAEHYCWRKGKASFRAWTRIRWVRYLGCNINVVTHCQGCVPSGHLHEPESKHLLRYCTQVPHLPHPSPGPSIYNNIVQLTQNISSFLPQVQSHRPANGYPGLSCPDEDLPQSRIDLDHLHASGHSRSCVFWSTSFPWGKHQSDLHQLCPIPAL